MMTVHSLHALSVHMRLLVWGLIATIAMESILLSAQGLGLSRLSLPFLMGTYVTDNRRRAVVYGFLFYGLGGWLFAYVYYVVFASLGVVTWWIGALIGLLHGIALLVGFLPLLPFIHPRLASEYHGVTSSRRLEPPGFLALNYGYRTPLTTLLAQVVYGGILGAFLQFGPHPAL